MLSSAPIFLKSHYFRQNIWIPVSLLIYIWGLVEQLQKWIRFRDELNTNLETAHQYFRRWKKRQIFVSFKFHFLSTECSHLLVCRILCLDTLISFFLSIDTTFVCVSTLFQRILLKSSSRHLENSISFVAQLSILLPLWIQTLHILIKIYASKTHLSEIFSFKRYILQIYHGVVRTSSKLNLEQTLKIFIRAFNLFLRLFCKY